MIPVADAVPDQETLALLAPIEEELQTWLDQPLGKVSGDMRITDPMGARLKEHPYIEFINRVQMAASGAKFLVLLFSTMRAKALAQPSRCEM